MTDTLPPRWAVEGFLREAGHSNAFTLADSALIYPKNYKEIIYGARLYAQIDKEPEDPTLVSVREAVAAYEDANGFHHLSREIREGSRGTAVAAALASLRASGVLK